MNSPSYKSRLFAASIGLLLLSGVHTSAWAESTCRADVVFAMDNTGSMGGIIRSTTRAAKKILDKIGGEDPRFKGIDVQFAVTTYWGDPHEYLREGKSFSGYYWCGPSPSFPTRGTTGRYKTYHDKGIYDAYRCDYATPSDPSDDWKSGCRKHYGSPSCDKEGATTVAVAGPNNHRVQLFKSDTAKKKTDLDYEKQWGGLSMITSSVTPDDGKFYHPTGIAMDGAGTTYVADTGNHRIQTFDIEGDHLLTIGDRPSYFSNMTTANKGLTHTPSGDTQAGGSATGQFSLPTDVAVAPNGDIWVLDEHNYRIQKFNAKGEFLLQVPKGGVRLLHTLPCAFLGTYSGGMKRLISAARGHPGASTCGPV